MTVDRKFIVRRLDLVSEVIALTVHRVSFSGKAILNRVIFQLFAYVDWLVFIWRWVIFEVLDITVLVNKLHLLASKTK